MLSKCSRSCWASLGRRNLRQRSEKSKGEVEAPAGAADTAAQTHGALRAEAGFTLGQMVSELSALQHGDHARDNMMLSANLVE